MVFADYVLSAWMDAAKGLSLEEQKCIPTAEELMRYEAGLKHVWSEHACIGYLVLTLESMGYDDLLADTIPGVFCMKKQLDSIDIDSAERIGLAYDGLADGLADGFAKPEEPSGGESL